MAWGVRALLLLVLPLLAGCMAVSPSAPALDAEPGPGSMGTLDAAGRSVPAALGAFWNGTGDFAFRYQAPADGPAPTLEVSIAWPRGPGAGAHTLALLDGEGATLRDGDASWFASTVLLDDAPSGDYVARVRGEGPVSGVVQAEAPGPSGTGLLLPDLVTLPPTDLRVASPSLVPTWQVAPGCDAHEVAERGARRCLRFSAAVGNVGAGPLEVRLATAEGVAALAGEGQGRFVQVLHGADGRTEEVPVGGATFHAAHGHYHYAGFARYELRAWEDGRVGDLVAASQKSGFCFFDTGLSSLGLPGTAAPAFARRADCGVPAGKDWVTGLSPNWYDFYRWDLTDQSIDLAGLPDGTYALVAVADPGGTLLEADRGNNSAGAVFTLIGDDVIPHFSWTDGLERPAP